MATPRWVSLPLALLRLALKLVWTASAVAIPALGVWLASSLAAYRNGPVWLACACGLLLFPALPLAWEGLSAWRRRRRARPGRAPAPTILTTLDRLILRTLALNLAVLAALLVRSPGETFAALSTRGDWFLDGRDGPRVERVRAALFSAADGLQWLHDLVHDNPFARDLDPEHRVEPPPVPEDRPPAPLPQRPPAPVADPTPGPAPAPPRPERAADGRPLWPMPATLHPAVVALPPEAEVSIDAVGKHLAAAEPDRWLRVKALHDYVADRVAYDVPALTMRPRPPQDAETVFRTRKGVCAGYAQLLTALGQAAGEDIVVVVGDARTEGSDLTGEGHAWNAAKIDGAWYFIDPTWDAGHVNSAEEGFVKDYDTTNLFTPPAVFGVTHFPEEPRWQLVDPPLTRGDFFRQPVMRPEFFAAGFELLGPDRSQVTVDGDFTARVRRPAGRTMLARYARKGDREAERCEVGRDDVLEIRCALPGPGTYEVDLFVDTAEPGHYRGVGTFEVHRTGA
jgi:hypothetical protein